MFITTAKCEGIGECVKACPTDAIRLIDGKAFSCITCGACADECPNKAIQQNKYGGFVVDRAKCNLCGICEYICPVNSIKIEDDTVKGICARCGLCEEACPVNARIDAFNLIEERQLKFLEALDFAVKIPKKRKPLKKEVKRTNVITDPEECIKCRRCQYYCPTGAIIVDLEEEGFCSECRICEDVCPVGAIKDTTIDPEKCTLCLKCMEECPNNAIYTDDFTVKIRKPEKELEGVIVSCLNCGLCASACETGALRMIDGKMRYDPSLCEECEEKPCLDACPVGTLRLGSDGRLKGYCVSCGKCVESCDIYEARSFQEVKWDGTVSEDCISCGTCAEVCPKDAITLKKGSIEVDFDRCILCEKCGIHCPTDAIPKTTMRKKSIKDGFTLIDDRLCIKCGLCMETCPEDAITKTPENIMVVDEDKCIYCGACNNICPAKAILFEREFSLSK
ncbi:4Fe-4S binding protein [Methanothermobacter tenebrarum]